MQPGGLSFSGVIMDGGFVTGLCEGFHDQIVWS